MAGLALIGWLLLRFQPEGAPQVWAWTPPLGLPTSLYFQLHSWSWLAGLGITLTACVTVSLPGWQLRPGFVDPRNWLLLLLAAALLVILAGNWLTLLVVWGLVGLLASALGRGEAGDAAQIGTAGVLSTLFLILTPLVNGGRSLESTLEGLALNAQAQFLLILAAALPLGFYPFHAWLLPHPSRSASTAPQWARRLALHLIPGLVALHLLGRFDLTLLVSQAWVPLNIVALFGSALAAWAERDKSRAQAFVLINRAVWAVLALGLSQLPAPQGAIFPLLTLTLGAVLYVWGRIRQNWPYWLGAAVLLGLPLTPGFAPNVALSQLATSAAGFLDWVLVLLAQTLLVAALVQGRPSRTDEPPTKLHRSMRLIFIPLGLSMALTMWYGIAPTDLAELVSVPASGPFAGLWAQLAGAGLSGWITISLPLVLGVFLAARDERWFGALRDWQSNLARVAGLEWGYGGLGRVSSFLTASIGAVADLVDGAGQFGWVVLVFLLAWLLLRG